jgi:serine/threonine protein kinase
VLSAEALVPPKLYAYALGVLSYRLLCGFPPYFGDTIPELFEQIMQFDFDFPPSYWQDYSSYAQSFISALLCPLDTRLDLEGAFRHCFFWHNCESMCFFLLYARAQRGSLLDVFPTDLFKHEIVRRLYRTKHEDCWKKQLFDFRISS